MNSISKKCFEFIWKFHSNISYLKINDNVVQKNYIFLSAATQKILSFYYDSIPILMMYIIPILLFIYRFDDISIKNLQPSKTGRPRQFHWGKGVAN